MGPQVGRAVPCTPSMKKTAHGVRRPTPKRDPSTALRRARVRSGSAVRSHPNAGHWVCRHGGGNADSTDSCWPNELEFAHSVGIRRIHSVQPAHERWSTTFTLAPILFPRQLRGTGGGFAAAVAKLGATLGVFVLPILKEKFGVPSVLGIISVVSLLGLVVTLIRQREDTE